MTTLHIKLFAILFMIIDHIGLFFFPHVLEFRILGRIAFPLFAWLIANGAKHTHNENAYLVRIFLLAIISQVPYLLANQFINPTYTSLNVLFTLGLGLTAIVFIKRTNNRLLWLLIAVISAIIAHILSTDYGALGVLMTVCFYLSLNNKQYMLVSQAILFLFPYLFLSEYKMGSIEPFGYLALLLLWFYNQKEGVKAKYLFYIFYPVQYVVIYLILLYAN